MSFSWTSLSLPTVGPPIAPISSQPIRTSAIPPRQAHRPNDRTLLFTVSSPPPSVEAQYPSFSHHSATGVREPFRRRNNEMTTWKHPGHSVLA
ncbi:hypothetical protein GCM10029976_043590 [Kribbella albertanoniae]